MIHKFEAAPPHACERLAKRLHIVGQLHFKPPAILKANIAGRNWRLAVPHGASAAGAVTAIRWIPDADERREMIVADETCSDCRIDGIDITIAIHVAVERRGARGSAVMVDDDVDVKLI